MDKTARPFIATAYRNGENRDYSWVVVDHLGDDLAWNFAATAATRADVSAQIAIALPGLPVELTYVDLGFGL